MAYTYQASPELGVVLFPKSASWAIAQALRNAGKRCDGVSDEAFLKLPTRYSFWREPHRRLESGYRMFFRSSGPHDPARDGFSNWVLRLCADDQLSEQHLVGQAQHLGNIPTTVIRWDFAELARVLDIPPIARAHESDKGIPFAWTDQAREAFNERYARDLEIWNEMTPLS
jgi:hypothetical protein